MSQKDNIFSVKLIKKNNKLIHIDIATHALFKEFINSLEEGQVIEGFFEAYKDDGTNVQLAKIHVSIRKIAIELGYTFQEMKETIKREAGLCWIKNNKEYCKSLADCSKEELGLVIETINSIGEMNNINFNL